MNLKSYEDALTTIDRNKTWVNVKYRIIFSREIKYRPYFNISHRYNATLCTHDYYLIVADYPLDERKWINTVRDNYGRIKIRIIGAVWCATILSAFKKDTNINIEHIEGDDICDVYYLDI